MASTAFSDQTGAALNNASFSAVVVDPSTSYVYVSSGQYIWRSTDNGDSWTLYYVGLTSEETNTFLFDVEEAAQPSGNFGIRAVARSRLVQGTNTGLYQFDALADPFSVNLSSPVFALWNGYLDMVNILEVVNKGTSDISVTVTMYDINGTQQSQSVISVGTGRQSDVFLNDLTGFLANSYGIVKLAFQGSGLEGRLTFYRDAADANNYEFVFTVPLTPPLTGNSAVGFNTFQPSTNPLETSDLVAQWLSIVNLDSSSQHGFTVTRYNQAGDELDSDNINVAAMRRTDIEGGHENPGASNVGLNVISPSNGSTQYLAHLVRYGQSSTLGSGHYAFAFPLLAKAGSGQVEWIPVSNGAGGDNWVELVNAGNTNATVEVALYDNLGVTQFQQTVDLDPHEQQHLHASSYLSQGMSGAVKITPSDAASRIITQSMFYFRDSNGSIEAMYGSQSKPVADTTKTGTYNLYLGMYNWLRLFNSTNSSQSVTVSVTAADGSIHDRILNLQANAGIDLGLHETANYGTQPNTYGLYTVDGPVLAELLRIRYQDASTLDFAAPTAVR